MPRLVKEKVVAPGFVVKLRQRLPYERYATEYSIQTYEDGYVNWGLGDCQCFGDDLDYMERKFDRIVENVSQILEVAR